MKRNRIILFLAIVLSGVLVSSYGGFISYGLFFGTLLLPCISACYMLYVHLHCRIYQLIEHKTVLKGVNIPYRFILANEDYISFTDVLVSFRSDYSTVENISMSRSYCLLPSDRIEQDTCICCHYRGEYLVGAEYVYITDFLRLFRVRFEAPSPITMHVMPRVLKLDRLRLQDEIDRRNQSTLIPREQKIPDAEVRDYIAGDERKQIHWKASAKQQKLMTRKQTADPRPEVLIFIDFFKKDATKMECMITEDKIIESTLAISSYYERNHTTVNCIFETNQLYTRKIRTKDEFDEFYEVCNTSYFTSKRTMAQVLMSSKMLLQNEGLVIIVTHTMSYDLIRACHELLGMDYHIAILLISDSDVSEMKQQLDKRIVFQQIILSMEILDVL